MLLSSTCIHKYSHFLQILICNLEQFCDSHGCHFGSLQLNRTESIQCRKAAMAKPALLYRPWLWQPSYAGCLSISSDFGAVHCWKLGCSIKSQKKKLAKNSLKPLFLGFKVVQGHQRWYPGKLISSACYNKQHVCVYLASATILTLDELIAVK